MRDIQCCVMKHDRKGAWVIYSVVYCMRREIHVYRARYTVFCTVTGQKVNVVDIECCVLNEERNIPCVIYSVV